MHLRPRGHSRRRRGPDSIVKNSASSFIAQMTTASLTAILTVFLVRALGPRQYGLFAVTIGMSAIAIAFADLGISNSTARFVAEYRGQEAELRVLIVDALKLKVIVTGLVCALLAALASIIATAYSNPEIAWPLRGMALATFGQSVYLMLLAVSVALGRTVVNVRLVAAESLLEVSATVALVLAGAGAVGAAFGRAIGYVLGAVIAGCLVLRLTGRGPVKFWRLPRRATVARVGGYARSVFAIDASYTLSSSLSVVFLGAYVGSAASGTFQAPAKLITLIQYVGLSTANGVAPRLTRGPGQEPNVRALHGALRGLIGFQCLMLAPAVVWAKPITRTLLGPGYSGSADVLTALAPYIFFAGLAPLVTMGVNYLGEARRRIPISLATLAITAVGGVILIPRHGVVGAAIATDIAFGFYTLAHIWLCRRLFELRIGMLVWSLACGLTAAVAMGIVLESFGTGHLTLFELLKGGAAGTATYVAMLIFTREVRRDHIAHLGAAVRARLNLPGAAGPSAPAETASFPADAADDSFWEESADAVPIIPSPGASIEPVASGSERPAAVAPLVAAPDEPRKRVWSVLGPRRRAAAPPPAAPATAAVAPDVLGDPRSPAASPPEWVEGMLSEPGLLLAGGGGRSSPGPDSRYARQADVPPEAAEPPREAGATGVDAAGAAPGRDAPSPGLRADDLGDAAAGRRAPGAPLSVTSAFGSGPADRPTKSTLKADALYEIAWRPAEDAGLFELRLADVIEDDVVPGMATSAVDQSPPVPWGWRMPPAPIPEARRAHETLVVRLLDEGWRRAGSGDIWFAHRFRPPEGVGADSARGAQGLTNAGDTQPR